MNIFSDRPIVSKEDDILNRGDFASNVAKYILNPSSNDGIVLSINGKWGSGKTSIANMIKEFIRNQTFTKDSDVVPIIVDYSPWNVTSSDQVIRQFLKTLREHFLYKKVLKILSKILGITSFILYLLPILLPAKAIIRNIDKSFKEYCEAIDNNKGDLEELKNNVERYLTKSLFRYVVFIDDLDRLNNQEIKLLIQLIKSTCNFSNITYVLLYDREIVANALAGEQGIIDGYSYLEKIVQIEFNIPSIKHDTIINILGNDIEEVLDGHCSEETTYRLRDYISLGLFKQISTIREEKRFINNLRFVVELLVDEIDYADLIAITYLRNLDENIYKLLLKYEDFILGLKHFYMDRNNELASIKSEFYKELRLTKYLYDKDDYLLPQMFPYMFSSIPESSGKDYLSGRICMPNMFHKYVNLDLDYEDISLGRINNILEFQDGKALSDLSKTLNPEQGRKLLNVLSDFSEELKDKDMFKHILDFLFNDLSELKYSRPFMIVDKNYYVGKVCNSLVHNMEIGEAESLLTTAVESGSDIGALVSLCNYLTYRDQDRRFDFKSVSTNTIEIIKQLVSDKALASFSSNIEKHYYNYNLIIYFVMVNSGDKLKELFGLKDNEWKARFIAKAIFISNSYTGHKHNIYLSYDLNLFKKALNIDKNNLDNLLKETNDNTTIQRLIVFKMQIDGLMPKDKNIHGFSIPEIRDYCKNNNIDFKPLDEYELFNTNLV